MPQQPPSSSPVSTPTFSAAKLLGVIVLFAAMLAAATLPVKGSWLWLLLPLAFLAYLDMASSAGGMMRALMAPQTWLFYGGLVAVAFAFEFGGLKETKVHAPQVFASNSASAMPPHFSTASSFPRPANSSWPSTTSASAPGGVSARPPAMPSRPTGTSPAPFPGAPPSGRFPVPAQAQSKPPQTVPAPGVQALRPSPATSAKPVQSVVPAVPAPNAGTTSASKKE